jgi:methylthioribose-1-phosphate isomerase
MLKPITWTGHSVRLLDQTRLPRETVYVEITDEKQMHDAIRRLVVRGAPAIGIAAAFGVYVGIQDFPEDGDWWPIRKRVSDICDYLATARPTAVNLFWALERMRQIPLRLRRCTPDRMVRSIKVDMLGECKKLLKDDIHICRAIGANGLKLLRAHRSRPTEILTHCNAGGLATAGFGTALAPIYFGLKQGRKFHVYVDETRPLLQGSRITAYELKQNGVPLTLLCDSMAAVVLGQKKVDAVIVGADRIAANGDTANKIGTLSLAIAAKHFDVPFYVAAPISTIDLKTPTGEKIPIEQRQPAEVARFAGQPTAPEGVEVFNPAFDVTPAKLIRGIITENGVARPPFKQSLAPLCRG